MLNNLNYKIAFFTLMVLILHCSFAIFISSSYTLTRTILSLATIIIFFTLSIKYSFFTALLKKYTLFYILSALLILQIFTSPFINTRFETMQQLYISLTIIFTFTLIFFTINYKYPISIKLFFKVILISILIILFFILITFLKSDDTTIVKSIELLFDNRRFLNHLQTLFIPLIYYLFLIAKSNLNKIFLLILIVINFNLIFITGARGTLYSLIIASLIVFFSSNKNVKKHLIFFYLLIGLSLLIFQIFLHFNSDFTEYSSHFKDIASSGRAYIFTTIIQNIFEKKYFFNAIGFATTDISVVGFLHPHNVFLYIFLGSGTIGLIIFLIIMIDIAKKVSTFYRKKANNLLTKFFTFSLLSIFIHSLVSGVYITPLSTLFIFYFIITMFTPIRDEDFKSYKMRKKENRNLFIYSFLILISIWYIIVIKKNLDFVAKYNQTIYTKRIPGIFLFNENIYKN